MDFKAVITAVLNKGNVEQEIEKLVQPKNLDITPNFGGNGLNSLNSQIKKQANANVKSYVTYSKSALQKMKYSSGDFFTNGDTSVDKGIVKRFADEAKEVREIAKDVVSEQGGSIVDAEKNVKKTLKVQEKAQKESLKKQEQAQKKHNDRQKALNQKAAAISSDVEAQKYKTKTSAYKNKFAKYADNNSTEYNAVGINIDELEKQRKQVNIAYAKYKKDATEANRDALISAHTKFQQLDKTTSNSVSMLGTSGGVLNSDIQKQIEKQHKAQEKEYSIWWNQELKKQEQAQKNIRKAQEKEQNDWWNQALKDRETTSATASTISSNIDNKSYDANYAQQKGRFNNFYNDKSQEYENVANSLQQHKEDIKALKAAQSAYKLDSSTANQEALIRQNEKVSQSYKTLTNDMKILNSTQSKALSGGQGIQQANRIRSYLEQNSKAAKQYGKDLEDLANAAEHATTTGDLTKNKADFNTLKSQIESEGLTGNSTFSEIKRGFKQIGQFVSVYGVLQSGMNKATEMVQNTYDVDDAMTQLQMATGVSNDKAKDLMKTYSQMGHQLKATGTDVAASSTEWMKQGQSVEQSNKLAESSIKLSKVGDLTSEDATKYLTSARKGYGITSAEDTLKIVDKLSSVDMASATDVGGLAEGMSEVATNANLAGVSMDKLLSYLAVIGETTQEGMSSVGTGLNAIFSRMGNIKLARLKDYQNSGEDLSDVETVLKGEGINLRDKTDTFRNFGDVLDEVAGKWTSYSDVSKRAIAKAMAGTNHMEQFLVLLNNYSKAQDYEKVSENSTGSTDKKYKVYEDSLRGRTEDLKNSFQSLSTTLADKNLIGVGVSGLTEVLNVVNKLISSFGLLKAAVAGFVGFKLFKNLG